ncbi:hypothetical protein [Burkholderia sp. Bp9142]|uniref:hypothetical protein n=1 Tax=Burkholderia sp. Bp9142 TaxID=2184573 RepID=UPI000F59555E|nr:hypothetical protein [Burkholderia sp. Bp9142]RQR37856.1 hypothetical protein DIE22_10195 [Burkholderia sp. Bp9142]
MTKVTFPLTGHSYSDDGSSDHDMLNGGHAENLLPMIGETIATTQQAVDAAGTATTAKQAASTSALAASQSASDAGTAQAAAQTAATQAKAAAATVNLPPLAGRKGLAVFVLDDESGYVYRRVVRNGGGANQTDAQLYFGQDAGQPTRIRVTLSTSDLGCVVFDSDLQSAKDTLNGAINTKADAQATANALATKANAQDLANTNAAVATKASQDALNVTNNNVNGKAANGARVQWDSEVLDFGVVSQNINLPAPYVLIGLYGPGNATANAIGMRGVMLRNA